MCGICGCDEPPNQHSIPFGFQGTGKALAGEGEGVYTEYMTEPESHEQHSQNLKGEGYISHSHDHHHAPVTVSLPIEQQVLQYNQQFANANRNYFADRKILAVNVMSSPGAGKTTLLANTLSTLRTLGSCFVIVADQQTHRDAERLSASGVPAWQINTGKGCHLDAHQLSHALESLALPSGTLLFIENVGNLVCPALFDLGEALKVVLLSVTEGDDKPLKYPHMFHAADLIVLTKVDLLPYVDFDVSQCLSYIHQINPRASVLQLSSSTGESVSDWYDFIQKRWI